MIYIREGTARIRVDHKKITANAGDLIICDSGQIHDSVPGENDNSIDFIIFDTGILGKLYGQMNFEKPLVTREELQTYGLTEELDRLFELVFLEMKEKNPYYQEIVKSSLRRFWFWLKRNHPQASPDATLNSRGRLLYDLHELLSYMDAHFSEAIPLQTAADKMNLSVFHFSKIFKKLMGIPYVTYLNMIRVEHAAEQMKLTGKKLLEIALNSGFNNIRTFNRVFKQITGYTPSEFSALREPDIYAITYHQYRSGEERFTGEESVAVIKRTKET